MKVLVILNVLIILALCQNCSHRIEIASSPYICLYTVAYQSANCLNPIFQACTITTNTTNINTTYNNKQMCSQYCCSQPNNFCPVEVNQQVLKFSFPTIAIVLSSLLFSGLAIVCCFRFSEGLYFCCRNICCCIKVSSVQNSQSFAGNQTELDINLNLELNWIATNQNKIKDEDCPICLSSQVNISLDCGHLYHRECIMECLKRKFECVLCRLTQLQCFRVYCQGCFQSYTQIYAPVLSSLMKRKMQCLSCSQSLAIVAEF